jgi:hypothetical protein
VHSMAFGSVDFCGLVWMALRWLGRCFRSWSTFTYGVWGEMRWYPPYSGEYSSFDVTQLRMLSAFTFYTTYHATQLRDLSIAIYHL